jgi:hypothetical protein
MHLNIQRYKKYTNSMFFWQKSTSTVILEMSVVFPLEIPVILLRPKLSKKEMCIFTFMMGYFYCMNKADLHKESKVQMNERSNHWV